MMTKLLRGRSTLHVVAMVLLAIPMRVGTFAEGICSRTEPVRDAILHKLPAVHDCGQVTANNLAGIEGTLDIRQWANEPLAARDFEGLVTSYVLEAPLSIPLAVVASVSATGGTPTKTDSPGATAPGRVLSIMLPAGSSAGQRISVVPDNADEPVVLRLALQLPPGEPPFEQMHGFELVDENGRPHR